MIAPHLLKAAGKLLGLVVPKTSTLEACGVVRVQDNRLTGYGPDLSPVVVEIAQMPCGAPGESIAIPWGPLQTVLGLLDGTELVEVQTDSEALTITQGADSWTIQAQAGVPWPAEPEGPFEDLEALPDPAGLQELATLAGYADDLATALRCVWQEGAHAVATDGKRALAVPLAISGLPPVVPLVAEWIAGVTKGAQAVQVAGKGGPALLVMADHGEGLSVSLRVRHGAVPGGQPANVLDALRGPGGAGDALRLTCESADLVAAIKRALALASKDERTVVLTIGAAGCVVEPLHKARGRAKATVAGEHSGEGRAAANGDWLARLVKDWPGTTVTLQHAAGRWTLEAEDGRLGLLMAVSLP